jgi:outer membrane protein OmpA-like peptidoglycan-associated protein
MSIKKNLVLVSALAAVMGVTSCTTNPYTGQQEMSNTGAGAIFGTLGGAAVGAGIGAIAGGGKGAGIGAAIGAGVGAIAGTSIGAYQDKQAAQLRQQLQGTGVQVQQQGNNIRLIMPGNITFANNSADINAAFYNTLNSVALVLQKYDQTYVRVSGYTSSVGDPSYNLQLSQRRASAVSSYLQAQGITSNRLVGIGYGEQNPIADNSTVEGQGLNRRVEILLVPFNN